MIFYINEVSLILCLLLLIFSYSFSSHSSLRRYRELSEEMEGQNKEYISELNGDIRSREADVDALTRELLANRKDSQAVR